MIEKKYSRIGIESIENSDFFAAAGRILINGFLLLGYVPPYPNKVFFFMLLSGKMPSNTANKNKKDNIFMVIKNI